MAETKAPSRFRRVFRGMVSGAMTLAVLGGSAFAIVSGSSLLADRADAVETPAPAPLAQVAVQSLQIVDGYAVTRNFVGQIEPGRSAALSFERAGLVSEIRYDEGDVVVAGDVIAQLDTNLLDAERAALLAERDAIHAQRLLAETQLERSIALQTEGHISQARLDQAQATRDELAATISRIEASLAALDIQLAKSVVYAPFDGRVGARSVEPVETVVPGQPVLTLVEQTDFEIRVGVPLSIDEAALMSADVAVSGRTVPASLVSIRPDVDPVTRTRTAIFATQDAPFEAAFGETATVAVPIDIAVTGAWVPIDALREGASGGWSILTVEAGIVRPAAVEALHTDGARAFVQGSFEPGAAIIVEGAHRVVPGQSVQALSAEG